ncbi:MAG: peptidylprolyl isomerase [Polyangiaceae bacterium]
MPSSRPARPRATLPILLGAALCALSARGDAGVVATVGEVHIGAGELAARAQRLTPLQLLDLGASWPAQRRRLLDEVLVREALLAQAARRDGLEQQPYVGWQRNQLLAGALLASLMRDALARVSDGEIARYHAEHQSDFTTPRSIEIWRLLAPDEPSARALLERARTLDAGGWSQLVRESSLDEATRMRSGSLGFVRVDGHTERPELRVAPELFAAADQVADGQLVPTPVREGERYAVVWRRRSRPAESEPLDAVREQIRGLIAERHVADESARVSGELRARVSQSQPELLDGLAREEPPLRPRPEPPGVAARSVAPKPQPSERGLR